MRTECYRLKSHVVDLYQSLYSEILKAILAGPLIHIDETTVRLRHDKGYVWVLTSMDKVYYFYKPSREGAFLKEMLANFSGVLVSDFYTAYDSLKCSQQKCLVHLVRDIDDDLLRNPLDMQLKAMAQQFGISAASGYRDGGSSWPLKKISAQAQGGCRSVSGFSFFDRSLVAAGKQVQEAVSEERSRRCSRSWIMTACRGTTTMPSTPLNALPIPQGRRWPFHGAHPTGVPRSGNRF